MLKYTRNNKPQRSQRDLVLLMKLPRQIIQEKVIQVLIG